MRDPAASFALTGRTAIVTGASRGIGAAIAQGFAEAGARVICVSRSGGTPSAGIIHEQCDLSVPEAATELLARVVRQTGSLNILVNAAAISMPPDTERSVDGEIARMRRTLEVDVVAAYAMVLASLPLMRAAGGGSIVNVTSINSILGFPDNPGYVASKAALAGLTRALAVDLAVDKIRVNALAPGYVRTAMTQGSYANPALNAQRRAHTLLDRWGEPDDMVGAAIFLAADASAYVTGQELFVDGGWTANGLVKTP